MEDNEQGIREQVEERIKTEQESAQAEAKPKDDCIPTAFIEDCFNSNERGDGILFAALHRGKVIFDKTSELWYRWAGHYWTRDKLTDVFELVEEVNMRYLDEAERLEKKAQELPGEENKSKRESLRRKRDAYRDRVRRLRGDRAQKCLTWTHRIENGLKICGDEFDLNPWLLACNNGVIELKTGRKRDGRPGDLITKAAPHEWKGIDEPAPIWAQFLNDIFANKADLIAYVRRLFGYSISGLSTEHILPVLHGEGRNGKGTLVETLRYVLGPLAEPIQPEMLLDQKNARSSSGPSPDLMSLKGLRIAFASETDEGRRFSTSAAKRFTGGDTLTGRNPHDRYETIFEPTHLLCLLTNHLPHAPGDDYAFWQRVHLVPFDMKFVDNPSAENELPKVKDLREKLKGEAPGILAWLVRGYLEWQREGLNPPPIVLKATEQYRAGEDLLGKFIDAYCHDPNDDEVKKSRTLYKDLYDAFKEWYEAEIGDHPPKKQRFGQIMAKRFKKKEIGGKVWYYGVSLKFDLERD